MIKYLNKCFELDSCNFDFDLDQHMHKLIK